MNFRNVVLIEDPNKLFGKSIKLSENNVFVGPHKIQEIEFWEERLTKMRTPYVLIQAETTMLVDSTSDESESRYAKGYFLLVESEDE